MNECPPCPKCGAQYTYQDSAMYICPDCAHEWTKDSEENNMETVNVIKDAYGNTLQDGDTITVIKDLKIKGRKGRVSSVNSMDEKNIHVQIILENINKNKLIADLSKKKKR